jgi:hypothetical protein
MKELLEGRNFRDFLDLDAEEVKLSDYALLRRKQNSKKLLIAFSGANTPRGKFNYYKQLYEIQENVLFLNTNIDHYYHNGIPGLGDNFLESIKILKKLINSIDTTEGIYTFGVSQGGWGALVYGSALHVNRIFTIGARWPEFSPALYGNNNRSQIITVPSDISNYIFNSNVDKLLIYGDHSWHDIMSHNFFGELINCKRKMYGNIPHNIAIHLVNNNKLVSTLYDLMNGRNINLKLNETFIWKHERIVKVIFKEIYSHRPSYNATLVYNTLENEALPKSEYGMYRLRLALAELHECLGDRKSAIGNYHISLSAIVSLPALKGLVSSLVEIEENEKAQLEYLAQCNKINFLDQERDEVGMLFLSFLKANYATNGFEGVLSVYASLRKSCSWAFTFPPLDKFCKAFNITENYT